MNELQTKYLQLVCPSYFRPSFSCTHKSQNTPTVPVTLPCYYVQCQPR
uniref:Uncharacterized protein n=1 Tax=Arundo donax TaxID=35708 RepID=A0A0A9EN26_ARUDO